MPVWQGLFSMERRLGLPILASNPAVKEAAASGPGMPAVQRMTSLATIQKLEAATISAISVYERAYAGGGWLQYASSTRVKDLQRTPSLSTQKCVIAGKRTTVICGTATRSKARAQLGMRPLAWRAPVIPLDDVDMRPLMESFPAGGDGCVFRDFVTPANRPHRIAYACGWANRAAKHETIVQALRDITGDQELGGHCSRHNLPEIGRALRLPRHVREALGYWRVQPIIADSENDVAAVARAVERAREQRGKATALSSQADRYSSVDGARVELDQTRGACLLAAREEASMWRVDDPIWNSTMEQIEAISQCYFSK